MGWHEAFHGSRYHHVVNRALGFALAWSRRLLLRLVRTLVVAGSELTCGIDAPWERRWGRRLNMSGHDRDPLASSRQRSGATRGWRWSVLTWVSTLPWAQRSWALPVLRVPASTPEVRQGVGRRHQTVPHWARQMRLVVRRWWP
jgi:hypothetical protein